MSPLLPFGLSPILMLAPAFRIGGLAIDPFVLVAIIDPYWWSCDRPPCSSLCQPRAPAQNWNKKAPTSTKRQLLLERKDRQLPKVGANLLGGKNSRNHSKPRTSDTSNMRIGYLHLVLMGERLKWCCYHKLALKQRSKERKHS